MFLEISNGMQEGKGANISKFDVFGHWYRDARGELSIFPNFDDVIN